MLLMLCLPPRLGAQGVDHASFTAMLGAHVTDGLVDYAAFQRDARFPQYLARLKAADIAGRSDAERLAFWVNVYNAYTIQLIISRGEQRSIKNINKRFGVSLRSPWAEPIVQAAGRTLTLDDVEHRIIRKEFRDPRIHMALVCAAHGCPPLRSEAYTPERLDVQLDDQTRRFLAQSSKNRVDSATGVVHGSPIFTWYLDDFGGTTAAVGAFWARYMPDGPARQLLRSGKFRWDVTEYDWSLNARTHRQSAASATR